MCNSAGVHTGTKYYYVRAHSGTELQEHRLLHVIIYDASVFCLCLRLPERSQKMLLLKLLVHVVYYKAMSHTYNVSICTVMYSIQQARIGEIITRTDIRKLSIT